METKESRKALARKNGFQNLGNKDLLQSTNGGDETLSKLGVSVLLNTSRGDTKIQRLARGSHRAFHQSCPSRVMIVGVVKNHTRRHTVVPGRSQSRARRNWIGVAIDSTVVIPVPTHLINHQDGQLKLMRQALERLCTVQDTRGSFVCGNRSIPPRGSRNAVHNQQPDGKLVRLVAFQNFLFERNQDRVQAEWTGCEPSCFATRGREGRSASLFPASHCLEDDSSSLYTAARRFLAVATNSIFVPYRYKWLPGLGPRLVRHWTGPIAFSPTRPDPPLPSRCPLGVHHYKRCPRPRDPSTENASR